MIRQKSNAHRKKVLLLIPEAFGFAGGIQMFCRALFRAAGNWAARQDADLSAIVLNDRVVPDSRYVDGGFRSYRHHGTSKGSFVKSYLSEVLGHRPHLVIAAHVNLSPLTLLQRGLGIRS